MFKRSIATIVAVLFTAGLVSACGAGTNKEGAAKPADQSKAPLKIEAKQDTAPPAFGGAGSAQPRSRSSILLKWAPASDDSTAQKDIVYHIYVGEGKVPTEADMTKPTPYITNPGATEFAMGALKPGVKYYFVIRARDMKGNLDKNVKTVESETGEPATPAK